MNQMDEIYTPDIYRKIGNTPIIFRIDFFLLGYNYVT